MNLEKDPFGNPYEHKSVESRIYNLWLKSNCFEPKSPSTNSKNSKPFVIIMPPPNVTGALHVGHALTASIQDALIRHKRMKGKSVLWLPGTDHAGIATQMVVERNLEKQKKTRKQLGRTRFLQHVWNWVDEFGNQISEQHKRLGASCDWNRHKFTMDEGPSLAVKTTFVNLYKKGLIYKGKRLINWSPALNTAISDLEVEYKPINGHLFYMKYPLENSKEFITVATTRPETYLGDTAVAVNPNDTRYKHLIGENIKLPFIHRKIKIISDNEVDKNFGTGVVKITPAHDPNDFEMGQRHKLDYINIFNNDASINKNGGPFQGLDRFKAREKIIEKFKQHNLLEKIESHNHSVGHCQRSGTIVEPILSEQWFLNMGNHQDKTSIAGKAYNAVAQKKIKIVPSRFTKIYLNWLENIRDWTISRQLWWGHRIPVWNCKECGFETASIKTLSICLKCKSSNIIQDPDVLDTWFSSALWPHSTLGWPKKTTDMQNYFPTSILETGYDILFFWVARMIMMTLENTNQIPFQTVYLHGLVRDGTGKKMSKSIGNIIDPLDLIDSYGSDALRFSLTNGITPGNDTRINDAKLESSRNFANKIWNAARFVFKANQKKPIDYPSITAPIVNHPEDQWILSRLNQTIKTINKSFNNLQIGEAQEKLWNFIWHEFCDWYIEMAKLRMNSQNENSTPTLQYTFNAILRLLHPLMPFITEEIWSYFSKKPKTISGENLLIQSTYPRSLKKYINESFEKEFNQILNIIKAVRNARSELRIANNILLNCKITSNKYDKLIKKEITTIEELTKLKNTDLLSKNSEKPILQIFSGADVNIYIELPSEINLEKEKKRLTNNLENFEKIELKTNQLLKNTNFVKNAPTEIIEKEKEKLTKIKESKEKLSELISQIIEKI